MTRASKIAIIKNRNRIKNFINKYTGSNQYTSQTETDNTTAASDLIIDSTEIYESSNVANNLYQLKDGIEDFITKTLKQENGPETALTHLNYICNAFNNYPHGSNNTDDLDKRIKTEEQQFLSQQFTIIAEHATYEPTRNKAIQCAAPLEQDAETINRIRELSKQNNRALHI